MVMTVCEHQEDTEYLSGPMMAHSLPMGVREVGCTHVMSGPTAGLSTVMASMLSRAAQLRLIVLSINISSGAHSADLRYCVVFLHLPFDFYRSKEKAFQSTVPPKMSPKHMKQPSVVLGLLCLSHLPFIVPKNRRLSRLFSPRCRPTINVLIRGLTWS